MNLATQSLARTSLTAAELWHQLELTQSPEEIDQLLQSIWLHQENQELSIDAQAELADQIDAELAAIKARMQFLVNLHQTAIDKLEGWRERLDQTILYFNQKGLLASEMVGKQRCIVVKENPPTCEVLVGLKQKSSPNKAQSLFKREEYVPVVLQPLAKTIRHACPECF